MLLGCYHVLPLARAASDLSRAGLCHSRTRGLTHSQLQQRPSSASPGRRSCGCRSRGHSRLYPRWPLSQAVSSLARTDKVRMHSVPRCFPLSHRRFSPVLTSLGGWRRATTSPLSFLLRSPAVSLVVALYTSLRSR